MVASLGCLILHGFTANVDNVRALASMAERLGMPYRTPLLRGHGTRPDDLRGVTWQDWYDDAAAALRDLRTEAERVVLCGHSTGGLVALHLAAERPDDIAEVVTIAAALRIASPLIHFSPILCRFIRVWRGDLSGGFADPTLATRCTNYEWFPTDAVVSLYRYGRYVERLLPRVQAPLLVTHSHSDRVIAPRSAEIIYERTGSTKKQLQWFDRSGHEMLLDRAADEVVDAIEASLRARIEAELVQGGSRR
ncbi:MAG: alpha/beta fold hydrolase [Chloroflexi bacterium]|nr:alpha/beta fold hydrolase [Chloroflexota bacterium]